MKRVKIKLHEMYSNTVDIETFTPHKVFNAFGHRDVFYPNFEMPLIDLHFFKE